MKLFRRGQDPWIPPPAPKSDEALAPHSPAPRRLRWGLWLLLILILLLLAGGGAFLLKDRLEEKIQTAIPDVDRKELAPLDPFNVLLVGSDSREGLTEEEQHDLGAGDVGGERADTLILAHIDPAGDTVVMVQFPRDLYVPIHGDGTNKINGALVGGPGQLVRTVEALTKVPIHHYAQVNIAGFRDLVDAIGGVEICITEPIPFDPNTGIEISPDEVPGMVEFDGERALRFVRSRNFTTGDFERIQNQQKFVAAAIDKITSAGTLLNPTRIIRLYRAAGDNLEVDQGTSINRLVNIAERLKSFDPARYEAYVSPHLGITNNEAGSVILPDYETMKVLFGAIRRNQTPSLADGVPGRVEPADVRVAVLNGTSDPAAGSIAAEELREATNIAGASVEIVSVSAAGDGGYGRSVVRYSPTASLEGQLVAAAVPGAILEQSKLSEGVDVELIVGADFDTRRITQLVPLPIPKPKAPPAACRT